MDENVKEFAMPRTGLCIRVYPIDRVGVQVDCPFLGAVIAETWPQVQCVQASCLEVRHGMNDGRWVIGKDRESLEVAKGSELRPSRKVIETRRLQYCK